MKKILFTLIIVSMAFIGLSFVSAADVNSGSSDLPIAHDSQPVVHDIKDGNTHPDDILSLEWGRRGPRGMDAGNLHNDIDGSDSTLSLTGQHTDHAKDKQDSDDLDIILSWAGQNRRQRG